MTTVIKVKGTISDWNAGNMTFEVPVETAMEDHINDLRRRAEAGDQDAIKSLAVFILIAPDK